MNRRSFLKILGLTAAATAVGLPPIPEFKTVEAHEHGEALINEVIAYDIYDDSWIVRWDIYNGKDWLFVTNRVSSPDEDRERYAPALWNILSDAMKRRGWKYSDLKPLTLPKNVWVARHIRMSA